MSKFGHIKLGFSGDLREYVLADPNAYTKALVNPMAVKLQQGAGSYDAFDNWAYWLQDNWGLGVGTVYPEVGGFAYGEIDSRYDQRLMILPRNYPTNLKASSSVEATWFAPGNAAYDFEIGPNGEWSAIAIPLGTFTGTLSTVWVYQRKNIDSQATAASIWSGATEPTTEISIFSLIADDTTMRSGYSSGVLNGDIVGDGVTNYWLVIQSGSLDIEIPAMSSDFEDALVPLVLFNGTDWVPAENEFGIEYRPFYLTDIDMLPPITSGSTFDGEWFVGCENGEIYKRVGAADYLERYELFATATGPINDMIEWWGKLIIINNETIAQAMDPAGAITDMIWPASVATIHRGFFWFAYGNGVYYASSENLDNPYGPIVVGPGDYAVRGISGNGNNLMVSTDQALFAITDGDFVFGLTRWDYSDPDHGVGMIEREGITYIPYGNSLLRYAENAPMANIWMRDMPLPGTRVGDIVTCVSTNKELIILINSEGESTAWSYNNQGWHCIAVFPMGMELTGGQYDYSKKRTYFFFSDGCTFWIPTSLSSQLPSQDKLAVFEPDSWLDTGYWWADLYSIYKDVESIEIVGDGITSEAPVKIFWKDDDSSETGFMLGSDGTELHWADGEQWETSVTLWHYLGLVEASGDVLRWDDPATRPATKSLRLGILMCTRNEMRTPVVRAIVVRHHPTVVDRWQHQVPISIARYKAGVDGRLDNREVSESVDHIDSMVGAVPPLIFEDVFGIQREVKVSYGAVRPNGYETNFDSSEADINLIYDLTLEEVINNVNLGEYTE